MNLKKILALATVAGLSACGGGGGHHHGPSDAQIFVDNLNYDDPIESYYVAKSKTKQYGYIVVQEGDGSYWGINIKSSTRYDYAYDLDYYLDDSFQVWYKVGTTNDYEDAQGYTYEKTTEVSKDLAKVIAVIQKARAKNIGEQLAANYGLSEARGIELGVKMVEYKDAKKTRAFTAADEDRIAMDIAGSSVSDIMKANEKYAAGDTSSMDALIQTAAAKNGTTPEHIQDLFKDVLGK